MAARKLYALFDYGTKIGEYTSKEIARLLEAPQNSITNYASTGLLYRGRYTFEVVEPEEIDLLAKKWEEVTKEVAKRLRGGIRKNEPVKN